MINNNETINAVIPQEIQTAIDTYKNQATTWGLEVRRLEMLKSQTEITLSKLQAELTDKKNQIKLIDERIKKSSEQLETVIVNKVKTEKDIIDTTLVTVNKEKEVESRMQEVAKKEKDNKKAEAMFVEKENTRKEELRKMEVEKSIISEKKKLLSEVISKL